MELPFRIETVNGRRVKIRDNGARGLAVADEALLWDVFQQTLIQLCLTVTSLASARAENERLLKLLQESSEREARETRPREAKAKR
jgi:hypothetical protein